MIAGWLGIMNQCKACYQYAWVIFKNHSSSPSSFLIEVRALLWLHLINPTDFIGLFNGTECSVICVLQWVVLISVWFTAQSWNDVMCEDFQTITVFYGTRVWDDTLTIIQQVTWISIWALEGFSNTRPYWLAGFPGLYWFLGALTWLLDLQGEPGIWPLAWRGRGRCPWRRWWLLTTAFFW